MSMKLTRRTIITTPNQDNGETTTRSWIGCRSFIRAQSKWKQSTITNIVRPTSALKPDLCPGRRHDMNIVIERYIL
ncbi:hypothetical protein DPMN_173667 [Dreissena polymorpha]|uniref:Uncharacterized protein n=1 Tax=Dreissena polymorpha TaxID=45954 RepID=A0A9D4E4J2_DREPO|nr:hypothetical protein DPMN_173667 [Dreissena polymorpha]